MAVFMGMMAALSSALPVATGLPVFNASTPDPWLSSTLSYDSFWAFPALDGGDPEEVERKLCWKERPSEGLSVTFGKKEVFDFPCQGLLNKTGKSSQPRGYRHSSEMRELQRDPRKPKKKCSVPFTARGNSLLR